MRSGAQPHSGAPHEAIDLIERTLRRCTNDPKSAPLCQAALGRLLVASDEDGLTRMPRALAAAQSALASLEQAEIAAGEALPHVASACACS